MLKLLCLVAFLLLLFLSFFVFGFFFSKRPRENFGVFDPSTLKTGDVILFSGKTFPERIICFLTHCEFSHCAMVVKIKDKIFLWEADIGQGKRKGPRMISFDQKLKRYKGYKTAAVVRIKKELEIRDFLRAAEKNFDRTMDECMFAYFFGRSNTDESVFCSELLARTLRDSGVIKKNEVCRGVSPSCFLYGFDGLFSEPEYFSW